MKLRFLYPLVLLLALASCEEAKEGKKNRPEQRKEAIKDNNEFPTDLSYLKKPRKTQLDSILYVLGKWNHGYNECDMGILRPIYHSRLNYEGFDVSQGEFIEEVLMMIEDDETYSQRFKLDMVQKANEHTDLIRCFVKRQSIWEGDESLEYIILTLKKFGSDYFIVGETYEMDEAMYYEDDVRGTVLPIGKSSFELRLDVIDKANPNTRSYEQFFGRLEINNTGSDVNVNFIYNDFDLEETKQHVTREAFIDGDELVFESSDYYVGEDISPDEDEFYSIRLKVLENELVVIETEDYDWEGFHLWRVK